MADASCSGSTPFKQLVDHQTRDVSHHQDRLVNHAASHHGGFRSAPQPGQGHESFGAFMNGTPGLPEMASHPSGRLAAHAAALEPALAPSFAPHVYSPPVADMSNWAADFRRFAGQQQQQPRAALPSSVPSQAAQLNHPAAQLNFQAAFAQPSSGFYSPSGGSFMNPGHAFAQGPVATAEFDQEMSRWMDSHGGAVAGSATRGMEDVDAVMDQMARELELNEAALPAETTETAHFTDLETPEIGNLSLESRSAPEPEEQLANETGPSNLSLAETAAKLLQVVQDEDGEKWQNSSFLSLMRDFRDGRKDIVDNEVRHVDGQVTEERTAN